MYKCVPKYYIFATDFFNICNSFLLYSNIWLLTRISTTFIRKYYKIYLSENKNFGQNSSKNEYARTVSNTIPASFATIFYGECCCVLHMGNVKYLLKDGDQGTNKGVGQYFHNVLYISSSKMLIGDKLEFIQTQRP